MRLEFKKFFEDSTYHTQGIGAGSMVPDIWSNSDSYLSMYPEPQLPYTDVKIGQTNVNIPIIIKKSIVTRFEDKKNPMYIELKDGTKLFITIGEYRRIQGDLPVVPKYTELQVTFQRLPNDNSLEVSKIDKIRSKFIGNSGLAAQYNIKPNSDAMML